MIRLLSLPFVVEDDAGDRRDFLPNELATLAPLFRLIGAHVKQASITGNGDLELAFDDGKRLLTHAHEDGLPNETLDQFKQSLGPALRP